jgi:hypothetical protein
MGPKTVGLLCGVFANFGGCMKMSYASIFDDREVVLKQYGATAVNQRFGARGVSWITTHSTISCSFTYWGGRLKRLFKTFDVSAAYDLF